MKTQLTALVCSLSALALTSIGLAAPPDNILAPDGKIKPAITFSDSYGEKVVTIPAPPPDPGQPRDPATHEVDPLPQKISAKIVANLTGFDLGEIGDDMAVTLSVGGFALADGSTLSGSDEALRTGSFPLNGKRATFPFIVSIDKPDGSTYDKRVGSVVFAWTATTLTVTLTCADIAAAGQPEIGASNYLGLYADPTDGGTKPSGSVKFTDQRFDVAVGFGSAVGSRVAFGKGVSATRHVKFGSDAAGTLEELDVQSVSLTGAADTTAPKVTATLPAKATSADGLLSFSIKVNDTPTPTSDGTIPPPTVEVVVIGTGGEDPTDVIVDPPDITDPAGTLTYAANDVQFFNGQNTVTITVTDESGNATVLTKKVSFTIPP